MASIQLIKGSDGSGNANAATVQSTRSPGASTINVDTVLGINGAGFTGSMGTPHIFTDPVTSETITVISEATAVDFSGHVDGSNLEIDDIAPGYTDNGSEVGDIVIIKPTTQYADNLAEVLEESLNDDGSLKDDIVTNDNMADDSVDSPQYVNNSIDAEHLATNALLLAYVPKTSDFSTASTTAVQVTGLTATVTVPPGGRSLKITAYAPGLYNTTDNMRAELSIWDGTVGSGTRLNYCWGGDNESFDANSGTAMAIVTPSPGSKTYNVGLLAASGGTANISGGATGPSFLLIEVI